MSTTYISADLRREVTTRASNCCEYCHISQEDQFFSFEIDHIISEKHGGATTSDNLCLSCPDCNAYKGSDIASVDCEDGETITGLFHPRCMVRTF
jgi:5-methylcytosine-specific restriction endonuclease McrA